MTQATRKQVSTQKVIAVLKAAKLHTVSHGSFSHGSGYMVSRHPSTGTVEVYWARATFGAYPGHEAHKAEQERHHETALAALTAAGIEAAIEDERNALTGELTGLRQIYCRSIRA